MVHYSGDDAGHGGEIFVFVLCLEESSLQIKQESERQTVVEPYWVGVNQFQYKCKEMIP